VEEEGEEVILEILRAIALSTPLAKGLVVNKVPPTIALYHTYMAMEATDSQSRRALVLAIAKGETNFERIERPGKGQCGVTQIETYEDRALCRRLADDPVLAYRAASEELDRWARFCRRNGRPDPHCMLTGYGKGHEAALKRPPLWVYRRLRMAAALERP
jgi:hypothetical protein